jgi:hypothetical protein
MIWLKLGVIALMAATAALMLWLLANWYEYSMSDFDCARDVAAACRRAGALRAGLHVAPALAVWGACALLLSRAWKKY